MKRALWTSLVVVAAAAGCSSRSQPVDPPDCPEPEVSADLEPFLESYFASWSRGDMDAYRDHFLPEATIFMIRSGEVMMAMPRDPFVEGQRQVRARSAHPGVERMTSFTADEDRQAAAATVQWELVQGEERTMGVDRFTLIRDERWQWKIISLTFYSTDRGRVRPAAEGDH